MEIRILHKQGKSIHAIARELSVSRATVRKYLRQPGLSAGYGPRKGRASKLDPFKDYLRDRIRNAAPRRLPATVYLREIRALGYDGGITILKGWLLSQRPARETPAIIRFETPPGKQAQLDWTQIRRGKNKLSAFVGTLGFSRLSFVWFSGDEKFETMVEAHERYFDALSGTPQTILYDNMKTVLIDRNVYGPGKHRFHAGFREFAKHHGFSPRMCAPYRAQTKGKVERFNRYLKERFVWPLESMLKPQGLILDAATANAQVGIWLRDVWISSRSRLRKSSRRSSRKSPASGDPRQTGDRQRHERQGPDARRTSRLGAGDLCSELKIESDKAVVTREVDGGLQTVSVALPVIVTTDLRVNEPRYASMPNITKAKKKPLNENTTAVYGVDTAPPSTPALRFRCRDSGAGRSELSLRAKKYHYL